MRFLARRLTLRLIFSSESYEQFPKASLSNLMRLCVFGNSSGALILDVPVLISTESRYQKS